VIQGASDGETLLTHTAKMIYKLGIYDYGSLDYICEAFLDNRSNMDIKTPGRMAMDCITVRMHDIVNKGYKSILQLLSLIESRDPEGWTPLASAAFRNNEALCELLVEKGCGLCLDAEQKKQLKPKLSCRIHVAAKGGNKTALQLLLDMGADTNEKNSDAYDKTALLEAVYNDHLSCVKLLIKRGADATISNNLGDVGLGAFFKFYFDLGDVSNPEPFQDQFTPRSSKPRSKRSSRGRMHNSIENGNLFVVRSLLLMGMDVEELDSSGRTPLVHAAVKHREAICNLLLEKSPSLEALKASASSMDFNERSRLLEPLIHKAMDDGTKTVTSLKLLVLMALGTNYGGDDNQPSSQSMMNVAIDMGFELVLRAVIHLEPQVLVEVDTKGRTPLVHAAVKHQKAICKLLLEKSPRSLHKQHCMDIIMSLRIVVSRENCGVA